MHIAECESGHVPATFAQTQSAGDFEAIFRSGIQLFIDFGGVTVFLTADRADFDFEHGVRLLRLVEQFLGDVQIFLERHGGAIPHMRLECRLLASCHLIDLMREQRTHPLIQILLGAVIGVQSDGDVRVFRSHFMCESRQRQRAGNAIIDPPAGDVGRASHGNLDDAVGLGVCEALQRSIQCL